MSSFHELLILLLETDTTATKLKLNIRDLSLFCKSDRDTNLENPFVKLVKNNFKVKTQYGNCTQSEKN